MQSVNANLKSVSVLAIRLSHYLILFFVIFGWVFIQKAVLIAHLFTIPLIILQWKINNGRCYLTDLEHYLMPTLAAESNNQSEGFVQRILKTIFKIELSPNQLMNFIYSVMAVSFLISLAKVCIL